jgi:hypothetical protein
LDGLKDNGITINEYEFDIDKLIDIQDKFEKLIESNISLFNLGVDAYKSYLQSFRYNKILNGFDIKDIDFNKVCKAFGFKKEPIVISSFKK